MMNLETRKRARRELRRMGFNLTTSHKGGYVRPRCSQCQALVINGVACHETYCPNKRKR